ncbi:uncharacterized protein LOC144352020 [Saccoglossus kowalevskii]
MVSLIGKCSMVLSTLPRRLCIPVNSMYKIINSPYSLFHRYALLPVTQQSLVLPVKQQNSLQRTPTVQLVNSFKSKVKLRKRCEDCYFVKREGRRYVMCKTHPRHKQRSLIVDNKQPYPRKYLTDQDFWY